MKHYELTYLSSSDVLEIIKKLVQEQGGVLEKSIEPSPREEGFLTCVEFSLEPEKIKDLEAKLKAEEKILRYMILNKKKASPAPTSAKKLRSGQIKTKKVELKEIDRKIDEILND